MLEDVENLQTALKRHSRLLLLLNAFQKLLVACMAGSCVEQCARRDTLNGIIHYNNDVCFPINGKQG